MTSGCNFHLIEESFSQSKKLRQIRNRKSETIPPVCVGQTNLKLLVSMELLNMSFYACVHLPSGMLMCDSICWRIKEWEPRIHSLECEVCVLSGSRAKNVSQTHCNNFKWPDKILCVISDSRWWVRTPAGCASKPVGHHHMRLLYMRIQTKTYTFNGLSVPLTAWE